MTISTQFVAIFVISFVGQYT